MAKACILAAGKHKIGQRHLVNPAVVPIGKKAVISYIVEKFPKDTEIVVALGYKKETIKEYLQLAHPDRTFTFVELDRFEGPGTGPGTSLLACREHLQCPFVLFTADTIVLETVPEPTENWVGVAPVDETAPYATVKIQEGRVVDWIDKQSTLYTDAYVGVAGIRDYGTFWNALEHAGRQGEVQITNGILPLMYQRKLGARKFTWFDTGTEQHMHRAIQHFNGDVFDFGKMDEFIYFVGDRVIKYYESPETVEKKVRRAAALKDVAPEFVGSTKNFFAYKYVEGTTLYPVMSDAVCRKLFLWIKENVWKPVKLSGEEKKTFVARTDEFYQKKTRERLDSFYEKTGIQDKETIVNDERIPPLAALLDRVDWSALADGLPGMYHGDCNFGNLIMGDDGTFYVIDWRQDMGGLVEYGDIYYDLAKLYGGMVVHFEMIRQNQFMYREDGNNVFLDFNTTNNILSARQAFESLVREQGYDLRKVKILAALAFLNMAPLHHEPYNRLLYYFGRARLHEALGQ